MEKGEFIIRVYALIWDKKNDCILLSDEHIKNKNFTKLPGGGLEFGEGIQDCLKRELKEELQLNIISFKHFYTCDFFQQSFFHTNPTQIISIYYLVENFKKNKLKNLPISKTPIFIKDKKENFRWVRLPTLSPKNLSLPIDKKAISLFIKYVKYEKKSLS